MTIGECSFDLKMDRAEKHLVDLKGAIASYATSHPYTVRTRVEGKRVQNTVHRLHFTRQPHSDISLIGADFIYNIRSGLDHLAAALVPAQNRSSVMFPIFFKGVWERPVEGENEQRIKDRKRWDTTTRSMKDGAVAILKTLQPDDPADEIDRIHGLVAVNRLSNRDRHKKLPVVASGLRNLRGHWQMPDGQSWTGEGGLSETGFLQDGGQISAIPEKAVNVKLEGSPVVVVSVTQPTGFVAIPEVFESYLAAARETVEALRPFLH